MPYSAFGELWETTMDPERRTLKRITMEDAVKADAIFNLLMGEKVEPRREYPRPLKRLISTFTFGLPPRISAEMASRSSSEKATRVVLPRTSLNRGGTAA